MPDKINAYVLELAVTCQRRWRDLRGEFFRSTSTNHQRPLLAEILWTNGEPDGVLAGIIAMAHALDVRVVALGVETDEQLQFLSLAGCDYAQGYLFSQPLTQDDFEAMLTRDRQSKLS